MAVIDDLRAYLLNLQARDVDQLHRNSDLDQSKRAQHHTLGPKGTQAAPGNHTHDGNDSPRIPVSSIVGFEDSGWVNVSLSSGIAIQDAGQNVQVRRIGMQVYWRGAFKRTAGFATNSTYQIVDDGAIPSGMIPDPVATGMSYAYHSGGGSPTQDGQIRVTSGNGLQLRTNAVVSAYYTTASIMYVGN